MTPSFYDVECGIYDVECVFYDVGRVINAARHADLPRVKYTGGRNDPSRTILAASDQKWCGWHHFCPQHF